MKNTSLKSKENEIEFQLMHRVYYNDGNSINKLTVVQKLLLILAAADTLLFFYLVTTS